MCEFVHVPRVDILSVADAAFRMSVNPNCNEQKTFKIRHHQLCMQRKVLELVSRPTIATSVKT